VKRLPLNGLKTHSNQHPPGNTTTTSGSGSITPLVCQGWFDAKEAGSAVHIAVEGEFLARAPPRTVFVLFTS
jgi:hypothetical protein